MTAAGSASIVRGVWGRRSRGARIGAATLATIAASAGAALASTHPSVLYKPPLITASDSNTHNSIENMTVARSGDVFLFSSTPSLITLDLASDPGCDIDVSVACPVDGVERIVLVLGNLNDSAEIDLGESSDDVRQLVKGQDDNDKLNGAEGVQKLVGGDGKDTLRGGPGHDILIGGRGKDDCNGGPGKDELKSCE